jgi:hypothetical protein
MRYFCFLLFVSTFLNVGFSQLIINEGCNKNYLSIQDEDGDLEDWVELYNSGSTPLNLYNYALSDSPSEPLKWKFSDYILDPGQHEVIFCSAKNRYFGGGFDFCLNQQNFTPTNGWNTHNLTSPFIWDGVSNIILNICSYNNTGYTENSIFYQTATTFPSTLVSFVDGSPAACSAIVGQVYNQRPNIRFNGFQIGFDGILNNTTDYPAPYGNWYWGARHQIIFLASELTAAGLSPGPINNIAFNVASTNGEFYNYLDFSLRATDSTEISTEFMPLDGTKFHTNFKLDGNGENVYLFSPDQTLISQLRVESPQKDISCGHSPDASGIIKWMSPTPNSTNQTSQVFTDTLIQPTFSVQTGIYSSSFTLSISNPNLQTIPNKLVYTLDGSTPTFNSTPYSQPITISNKKVVRAAVFPINQNQGVLPSKDRVATYLFNISHSTPILIVTTDYANLYGTNGIFDNFNSDWIKPAHAAYLDSVNGHPLLFETKSAIRMDGGAGGSRSHPQHSFRLSFNHGALGEKVINQQLIPDRKDRFEFSDIYLRNGSNQYLTLPYKDASQVRMMSEGTNNYYSSFEPVTVYINGEYFGLYELREKFNTEYFNIHDNAKSDSLELLSLSYFYNLVLRAVEGDVDNFYNSYDEFLSINTLNPEYFNLADKLFDLKHYSDYIIAESFMGNVDWPGNNIKIYRSDKTNYRWRFCLIDLELSMQPNGWTSCVDNHIRYMLDQNPQNPYINIWLKSIKNNQYLSYFINRYADLLNTSYQTDTLLKFENRFYNSMVEEMPNEFQRWGDPNNIAGQMQTFNENHNIFRSQLACRGEEVRQDLLNEFDLQKQIDLELDIFPANSGSVKLNTIEPKIYPWSGIYFDGVAVKMEANAKPGYEFSHWKPNAFIFDTLNPVFEGNIDSLEINFTAVFKALPPIDGDEIHFSLYPNPATSEIILSHDNKTLSKGCDYKIVDLNGRVLLSGKVFNDSLQTPIPIDQLSAACYFLQISKFNEKLETIKFIKR